MITANEFIAVLGREIEILVHAFTVVENDAAAAPKSLKSPHMNSVHCFDWKNSAGRDPLDSQARLPLQPGTRSCTRRHCIAWALEV